MTSKPKPAAKRSARKPAAVSKAAAARAEKAPEGKHVLYRGVKVELPAELAGDLYFAYADLSEDQGPAGQISFLRALIGDDQVRAVRATLAESNLTFAEMPAALLELFDAIWGAYGMGAGEPEASSES